MSLSTLAVRFAARTLPAVMRDRYREQWMADLRDAEEAGLRPSEIAIGSLAFAASLSRPISGRVRLPRAIIVERRTRLASALALCSAVLSLSTFANVGGGWGGLTGIGVYDFLVFLSSALILLFFAFALVVPLVLAAVTQEMASTVRLAVVLLALASLSPLAQSLVYRAIPAIADQNIYLVPGLTFIAGVVLAAIASALLARHFRQFGRLAPAPQQPRLAVVSLSVSLLVVAGAVVSLLTYRSALREADAAYAERWYRVNPGLIDHVTEMHAYSDQSTANAIGVWAIFMLVASISIGVSGYFWPRLIAVRTIAMLLVVAISAAGVQDFVSLFYSASTPGMPEELLLFVGRWGLVALILYAVGGVHFARKPVSAIAPT